MNSVLSAFKSSKSDSSSQCSGAGISVANASVNGSDGNSSYANLRHIREIGSTATMSTFVADVDNDSTSPTLRLGKCTISSPTIIPDVTLCEMNIDALTTPSRTSLNARDEVDHLATMRSTSSSLNVTDENDKKNVCSANDANIQRSSDDDSSGVATTMSTNSLLINATAIKTRPPRLTIPPTGHCVRDTTNESKENCLPGLSIGNDTNVDATTMTSINGTNGVTSDSNLSGKCAKRTTNIGTTNEQSQQQLPPPHTPVLSAANNRNANKCNSESTTSTTATTLSNKSANRFHKRLSLSGIGNNPLPSVHGRPNSANAGNGTSNGTGETKRTRMSTHQRNLSLDFR